MATARMKEFLGRHRPVVVLVLLVLLCTTFPPLATHVALGNAWQGIPPSFTDEGVYYAHMHTVAEGYLTDGNPFFFEHRNGPPFVIFGGVWLSALPLLAGLPFNVAIMLNFILWSLAFALMLYWLFREWLTPRWLAVSGTLFIYLQSLAHVWRAVNLQTVYPFHFLFYVALTRLIREQSRKNITLLAATIAASFYIFAYLWQIAAITLGLLLLYALAKKRWLLAKATVFSGLIGAVLGSPVLLYMLWLSHASPYFWESIYRLGLVNTHIPMAEVIYSGGWIGVILAVLMLLYLRKSAVRKDREFVLLSIFLTTSGLGLWVMQGSNLVTGKLLETGEHVRTLIIPWLSFATILVASYLWQRRAQLTKRLRALSIILVGACALASCYFFNLYFVPFVNVAPEISNWKTEELYAKPFAWLNAADKGPVVVWSDPHDGLATYLPIFTKDFTLYSSAGLSLLVPEGEIRERYLISQYFTNPTTADLESNSEMGMYLGRHDIPHEAMTIARRVKICKILFFWDKNKNCGTEPTSQELLGDQFFTNLETRFQTDIKPNIKAYLKKYHVSYIIKDDVLDPQYNPEELGALRVYTDGRFEIYRLP
jgi:hypothetical protein